MSITSSQAVPASSGSRNEFTSGALILLATMIVWGVQFPVAKAVFETVDSFHAAVFRFSLPALILLVILLLREGWAAFNTGAESWHICVLGVIGMSATPSLIFGGLMFTRPEIAAIIVATQPLITVIAQRLMRGKNPDMFSVFCVIVAFVGVITVVTRWETGFRLESRELVGNLMVLVGATCWVTYTLALDKYRHWSTLRVSTITMAVGAVSNTVLVMLLVAVGLLVSPSFTDWYDSRWELLFLALVGVLGAMVGWNVGSRRVGALNAILFINLIPVVTFLVRYWQGYSFKTVEIVGALLVMGALLAQNLWARTRVG